MIPYIIGSQTVAWLSGMLLTIGLAFMLTTILLGIPALVLARRAEKTAQPRPILACTIARMEAKPRQAGETSEDEQEPE